jgi:two-component system nitrate/nitrite response regulator NarL
MAVMSRRPSARVVLADDQPIVLAGLKALVDSDPLFSLVAVCSDGATALAAIRTNEPELAVLDMSMRGQSGLEVLAKIRSEVLRTRVVLFTGSARDEPIAVAIENGASAVLLKQCGADHLMNCLRTIGEGRPWRDPAIADIVRRERERRKSSDRILRALTGRERETISLTVSGLSNKEIARKLGITEGTIKLHLYNIYQKLGVANRTALTALAHGHQELIA